MKRTYTVENLDCANCAQKIQSRISKIDGIRNPAVDFVSKRLSFECAEGCDLNHIEDAVRRAAVSIEPDIIMYDKQAEAHENEKNPKYDIIRIGICLAAYIATLLIPMPEIVKSSLLVINMAVAGYNVIFSAFRSLIKSFVFDENLLMTIAAASACILGEFSEGAAVMLFFNIGELFQDFAVRRSRAGISSLLSLKPDFANIETPNGLKRVNPADIRMGETAVVLAGERVPLDGEIISGETSFDTSSMTGETLPRNVRAGDAAYAGYINLTGVIKIRVNAETGKTQADRIMELVLTASQKKAKTEKFITTFARYYTPAVFAAAVLVAVLVPLVSGQPFSQWIYRALVLLVISCPCALVVSIPIGFFAGIGACARQGVLLKGGNVLSALARVRKAAFDKTGTLTDNKFAVTCVIPADGVTEAELEYAAAVTERFSSHPLARAVSAYVADTECAVPEKTEEFAGYGVYAEADGSKYLAGGIRLLEKYGISAPETNETAVYFAKDGRYLGLITCADTVKPDAKKAVDKLRALGFNDIAMLTGDTREAAEAAALTVGITDVRAGLKPADKLAEVEKMSFGGGVLFAGDGINDAPVLARADISVAMGGMGSDIAVETADAVVISDEPSRIASAVVSARRTRRIVTQNIVFALGMKLVIMALGVAGIASMWLAVFADVGVSLLAILNSMRALRSGRI